MAPAASRIIVTKIGFKIDGGKLVRFNTQIGKTKKNLSLMRREAFKARRTFNGMATAAKAFAGILIGGAIFRTLTTDFSKSAAAAGRMSKSLGVTVGFFSEFSHVLGSVGIEADETGQIIADISERMFDAGNGSKALADDFGQIGFSVKGLKELADKGPEAQIMALADAFKAAGPGAKRTFTAMSGLGDVGAKLLPIFEGGAEGLREMMLEARRLGVTLDAGAVKKAQAFEKASKRMKGALIGMRNEIGQKLLPPLTKVIEGFAQWAKDGDNVARMLDRVKLALKLLLPVLLIFVGAKVVSGLIALKAAIIGVVFAVKLFVQQFGLVVLKFALIAVAVAGVIMLVQDLKTLVGGGDSIFGRLLGNDSQIVRDLRGALVELGSELSNLWAEFQPLFVELWKAASPAVKGLWNAIKPFIPTLSGILKLAARIFVNVLIIGIKALTFILRLLVNVLNDALFPIARVLGGVILGAFNAIADAARWVGNILREFWVDSLNTVSKVAKGIGSVFVGIWEIASTVAGWIKGVFVSAWNAIAEAFPGPAAAIKKVWNGLVSAAKVAWSKIKGFGKVAAGVALSAWRSVSGGISSAFNAAKGAARDAWAATKSLFEKRVDAVGGSAVEGGLRESAAIRALGNRAPTAATTGAVAHQAAAAKAGDRTITVGAVAVNVSGSLNMDTEEAKRKIRQGAMVAVKGAFSELMKDRKPATTTSAEAQASTATT